MPQKNMGLHNLCVQISPVAILEITKLFDLNSEPSYYQLRATMERSLPHLAGIKSIKANKVRTQQTI